jgi:TRAP-type C4-dicarboxylate transport system permease small subunit
LSAFEASSERSAAAAAVSPSALLIAVERRTTALALWGACTMLVIAAVIGLYQILSRFILLQPAEWSEVSVRFALIWMVFLAIPMAFRQGAMVCVDLLYRRAGPRGRRGLDTAAAVMGLLLVAVLIWFGVEYAWRTRFQTVPGIESMTMVWAYAAMPIGGVFSVLAILAQWFDPRRNELETAQ